MVVADTGTARPVVEGIRLAADLVAEVGHTADLDFAVGTAAAHHIPVVRHSLAEAYRSLDRVVADRNRPADRTAAAVGRIVEADHGVQGSHHPVAEDIPGADHSPADHTGLVEHRILAVGRLKGGCRLRPWYRTMSRWSRARAS